MLEGLVVLVCSDLQKLISAVDLDYQKYIRYFSWFMSYTFYLFISIENLYKKKSLGKWLLPCRPCVHTRALLGDTCHLCHVIRKVIGYLSIKQCTVLYTGGLRQTCLTSVTTRPSIRCSFVLDLDIGAHLGAKPLIITEEWLLPTWRNEHRILYYNSGTDPFIS